MMGTKRRVATLVGLPIGRNVANRFVVARFGLTGPAY